MFPPTPDRIALFPLSSVLFPGAAMTLHLFEPRYLKLMAERLEADPIFGVVLTRDGHEVGDQPEIHEIGVAAALVTGARHEDGRYSIVVQGTSRFRAANLSWANDYLMADVTWLDDEESDSEELEALSEATKALFIDYVIALAERLGNQQATRELPQTIEATLVSDPERRAYQIASQLPLNSWQQQELLELPTAAERVRWVHELVKRERRMVDISGPATSITSHPTTAFSAN